MKKEKFKKRRIFKIFLRCCVFCLGVLFVIQNINVCIATEIGTIASMQTGAGGAAEKYIQTADGPVKLETVKGRTQQLKTWLKDVAYARAKEELKSAGSKAYYVALTKALNTIAYDTATWLGSGGKGQQPLFITEGWGEYLTNIGDNAAGDFIETLGKENSFMKFNLCEPDLALKMKIGLGLTDYAKPSKPACTFSKMKENWEEELRDPDFLPRFQDMFEPTSNDLARVLTLQTGMIQDIDVKKGLGEIARIDLGGWLDERGVDGKLIGTPKSAEQRKKKLDDLTYEKVGEYTGDAFIDAINVFLNQLALTAYNKLMDKLGEDKDTYTHPHDWDSFSFESGPSRSGIAGAKAYFRELLEPRFDVRGDYNILTELTTCPDPTKAGPTNCVIMDNFNTAIIDRLTVGQAMDQGYLNANGVFGFKADGLEPNYIEGYPYRSMMILRKFRIIPVGWELAAQYIKDFAGETLNLSDLVACYDPADDWTGYDQSWCKGLVDPNWVLKAPLNYCKREGAGPEIISEQVTGEGYESELVVSRNDNYCADEQSCIKENADGSCKLYGYCSEERRKWQFNSVNCEPKYNTCQTFRSREGNTVSYLENTLDYRYCDNSNVGCQPYCEDYNYATSKFTCAADTGDKAYFDKDIEECDSDVEGCHEFIRTKAGLGANLLHSSSFEYDSDNDGIGDGWEPYHIDPVRELVDDAVFGNKAQKIVSGTAVGSGVYGGITRDILPLTVGETYTISFYAKKGAMGADNDSNISFSNQSGAGDENCLSFSVDLTSEWKRYSKICVLDVSRPQIYFWSSSPSEEFFIDAVKLERGITATAYSDYRENGLVYQKLAPDYLGCTGAASDPDECDGFVRQCSQGEVGCELYTSASDDMSIPAKVIAYDYCTEECVGYDAYIQKETVFDSLRDSYFIPSTAQACGSESIGCDEWTNLDEVAKGGEGIEYYSYLRQCVKPTDPDANCADFYTWEGSNDTGFQLKLHKLQTDISTDNPDVTSDDSLECNAAIYALPETDPGYNPDCREFYNNSGGISYHLYHRTISCDANCHPYRRTENNIDPMITDEAYCNASGSGYSNVDDSQFHWDDNYKVCYFCKNGGEWNTNQQSCIYMAIPDEGIECSSGQNGCREYTGNTGNNMKIILNNDFEGSLQGWEGIDGSTAELSSTALIAGGESLYISGGSHKASAVVGNLAQKDKSYILTFLAKKAEINDSLSVQLVNNNGDEANFGSVVLSSNWQLYKMNLAALSHDVSDTESLILNANTNFYIDDIKLTEITEHWYLIKNSWATPDSCYDDVLGNYVGPVYNLGCDEYKDRDDTVHCLHSFNQLCLESSVGCEIMIDTHNLTNHNSQTFNSGDLSEIIIPADEFIYVVYNQDKQCNYSDKGCQLLGKPYQYKSHFLFSDVYSKNNPDKYDEILCLNNEIGCEEWAVDDGKDYFKDPGNQVCEWRQGYQGSFAWYRQKVTRCENNNEICLSDTDCESGISCIFDDNDYACDTSLYKTLGIGGYGNAVRQPIYDTDGYWVGLCPVGQSGCTEYIDPVSNFSSNIIFNSDFSQNVDGDNIPDGWSADTDGEQNIVLEPNTLYILAVEAGNTASITTTNNLFYELNSDNILSGPYNNIAVVSVANSKASKRFYTQTNISEKIVVSDTSVKTTYGDKRNIELKKAIIDYQLKQGMDKTSCNGIVDFDQGCVLFNERYQNGFNKSALYWDADHSDNIPNAMACDGGACEQHSNTSCADEDDCAIYHNANFLIKVTPDRVCDKWLACRSFIKDENNNNVCFDVGLCDSVDDNENCNGFVVVTADDKVNQTYNTKISAGQINNMSGYVKVGYNNSSLQTDYYPLGAMDQVGEVAKAPNGGFEWAGSNGYPIGWSYIGGIWDETIFKVIDNPIEAQVEGIGYAPEGRNFLKLGSIHSATSEFIDVEPNINYILTAYINTINLSEGTAAVKVEQFNDSGNLVAANNSVVTLNSGNKWTYKLGSFTTIVNASRIKITLHANTGAGITGNFYFDDVKIRPALNSKDDWWTPQTCRLYPEDDSLSCDYYEDSGKRQKGWLGYCLEYDRYPGSDDACLLWWPVDKVKGEGIEEGAGYIGKVPVHYCAEAEGLMVLEYRQPRNAYCMYEEWFDHWCNPTGAGVQSGYALCGYNNCCYTTPSGTCITGCSGSVSTCSNVGWYEYNGSFVEQEASYGIKFYDPNTGEVFDDIFAYCTKVVQTVNSVGGNKYWAGRVYEGSDYKVSGLEYEYSSDYPPFGAIVEPFPANNPYEWDGSNNDGIQPLYVIREGVRASHPYKIDNISIGSLGICRDSKDVCLHINGVGYEKNKADCPAGDVCNLVNFSGNSIEKIKRLFAQSYGYWEWDGSHYMPVSGQDWTVPTNVCNGTGLAPRPDYSNDFCGILPVINNIKANNQGGNVELNSNQFINLTFNSYVDSQQLPLVMYAVNWGDNESTVVTGVEMRDRPNIDNPNSLYHLYNYWDLKAKHSVDQESSATIENDNTIYCGGIDSDALNYNGSDSGYDCPANSACCIMKLSVKVKDNWGWCNNGVGGHPCPTGGYQAFGSWIVVKEK